MEDFCQLSGRATADKYSSSYERCAQVIQRYSSQGGLDVTELYLRLVFCFLTGNSDMHLKNFSLIEESPGERRYHLSPAYDLLPVNVVMPEDTEETALTLGGKKGNLHRFDFLRFAQKCGIPENAAERMMDSLLSKVNLFLDMTDDTDISNEYKQNTTALIKARAERLRRT